MNNKITFDINREGVESYKRIQHRTLVMVLFGLFLAFITFISSIPNGKNGIEYSSTMDALFIVVGHTILGFVIGAIITIPLHMIIIGRNALKYSKSIFFGIDGEYIHIIENGQTAKDRKIHLSNISEISILQDSEMRKCNIQSLVIQNNAQSQRNIHFGIIIPGVIDAESVRNTIINKVAEVESKKSNVANK